MRSLKPEKPSKFERLLAQFAFLIIFFTACIAFYFFYLLFFPPKVLTINSPLRPDPAIVKEGDSMQVDVNYCKKVSAISIIVRSLISENGKNYVIPFTELSSTAPVGCGRFFIPATIPTNIPTGKYRLSVSFEYQANVIRTIFEEYQSEPFTIIK